MSEVKIRLLVLDGGKKLGVSWVNKEGKKEARRINLPTSVTELTLDGVA